MSNNAASSIYIYGKLPFVLLLEDTISEHNEPVLGKEIRIVNNDGDIVASFFQRKEINMNQAGTVIASEDLFGELTFSRFCLIISEHSTKGNTLDEKLKNGKEFYDFEFITSLATTLINKLITFYKIETRHEKDWIPQVTSSRLSPWRIDIFDATVTKIRGIECLDYRGTGQMLGTTIDSKQLIALKQNCEAIVTFNTERTLQFIQEANRYKKTGDYTAMTIFLAFYIESWILREVEFKLTKNGITPEIIMLKMKNKKGNYLHRDEIIKLVNESEAYKKTIEYEQYDSLVLKKRNNLAHGTDSMIYIDKRLAEEMTVATMRYRDLLQKIIWS